MFQQSYDNSNLTYYIQLFSLFTPANIKLSDFLMFLVGIERDQWYDIDWWERPRNLIFILVVDISFKNQRISFQLLTTLFPSVFFSFKIYTEEQKQTLFWLFMRQICKLFH